MTTQIDPVAMWTNWMYIWLIFCLGAWILERAITHAMYFIETGKPQKLKGRLPRLIAQTILVIVGLLAILAGKVKALLMAPLRLGAKLVVRVLELADTSNVHVTHNRRVATK